MLQGLPLRLPNEPTKRKNMNIQLVSAAVIATAILGSCGPS